MFQKKIFITFNLVALLMSCAKNPTPTTSSTVAASDPSNNLVIAGDIIVANSGGDLMLLSSTGSFKAVLYDNDSTTENIDGVRWYPVDNTIILPVDGVDRVLKISVVDGSNSSFIVNANLAGNLRGVGYDPSTNDLIFTESNNLERFDSSGIRVTDVDGTSWPRTNLMTTFEDVYPMANGGFVGCSSGTDRVRTYTSAGIQVNETDGGPIAGTTDAFACMELADGSIGTIWEGTTDTVIIYSSDLSTQTMTYSNTSILGNPQGIAERANGNLLITDFVFDHIVEITRNGTFVQIIGSSFLNAPKKIFVVPEY